MKGTLIGFFRDARWFNARRATGYSVVMLLAFVPGLSLVALVAAGDRPYGINPAFIDFAGFWTAARLALHSSVSTAYDVAAQHQFQHDVLGGTRLFVPFYYPPPFLLLVLPLGLLAYLPAFGVFDALSYAAYLVAAVRLLPRGRWTIAANPAALITLMNGQSAGIVAALFTGASLQLARKPFVSGLLFGALVIKPQFGLLLPVAFVAGRQGRAFAGAVLSASLLLGGSILLIGRTGLTAWLASLRFAGAEMNMSDILWRMQSPYAALRLLHVPMAAALGLQAAITAVLAVLTWKVWRGDATSIAKCAMLTACALMATPYMFDYDLMLAIVPLCWLAGQGLDRGFLPWERSIMASVFLLPLAGRGVAALTHVVLGPFVLGALVFVLWRRLFASCDPASHNFKSVAHE